MLPHKHWGHTNFSPTGIAKDIPPVLICIVEICMLFWKGHAEKVAQETLTQITKLMWLEAPTNSRCAFSLTVMTLSPYTYDRNKYNFHHLSPCTLAPLSTHKTMRQSCILPFHPMMTQRLTQDKGYLDPVLQFTKRRGYELTTKWTMN